jgi:hypothetical protein
MDFIERNLKLKALAERLNKNFKMNYPEIQDKRNLTRDDRARKAAAYVPNYEL